LQFFPVSERKQSSVGVGGIPCLADQEEIWLHPRALACFWACPAAPPKKQISEDEPPRNLHQLGLCFHYARRACRCTYRVDRSADFGQFGRFVQPQNRPSQILVSSVSLHYPRSAIYMALARVTTTCVSVNLRGVSIVQILVSLRSMHNPRTALLYTMHHLRVGAPIGVSVVRILVSLQSMHSPRTAINLALA
jgi:hypothetical protein